MNNLKGETVLIKPTIHPYAGIVRIRLEGIISAHTRGHPLNCGCKGTKKLEKNKIRRNIFWRIRE